MADDVDPTAFAAAFIRLMSDVHRVAGGEPTSELATAIAQHLGVDPSALPVVEQVLPLPDHPNVQLALEEVAAGVEGWRLFGLPVDVTHWTGFGLANLASPNAHGPHHRPTAPAYVNVPIGVGETLPCVSLGVWLLAHEGRPVVVLFSLGDNHRHGMGSNCRLEAMAEDRETAVAFLAHVQARVHALNVYRGKVLSFTFGEWGGFGLEFHALPDVGRDDLVLPEEDLAAIERHTLGVARHADRLRGAKRHLKRGLLLYGPPGTGKTFSIMYLCSQMPGRTAILLSGQAAPTLGQAAAMARSLQPSMLVLEDVDLVAMERTHPGMSSNPLLFQLLNEMDGLDEDADVLFVLTTNRVELLEPALAARPGRIDQAVEIRLPDDTCRARLLVRSLDGLDVTDLDVDEVVARTVGVSASFLKELGRRAALVAAEATPDADALVVRHAHVMSAIDDLLEHSTPVLRRSLGAEPGGSIEPPFGPSPAPLPGSIELLEL